MLIGDTLGPYRIVGKLGEGGMGQVFRARDTTLDRDVAIKVLPEAFAHDAERLARFTREAKTLASLNHPNIAAIYGLEKSPSAGSGHAGITALVMELVEGDDLSQRIARLYAPGASAPEPDLVSSSSRFAVRCSTYCEYAVSAISPGFPRGSVRKARFVDQTTRA